MTTPFDDQIFRHSVSQVEVRAESQQSLDLLAETFVDPGVTDQLENDNSQIIYGRRGTGKTHMLKFIEQGIDQLRDQGRLAIYLDMRILGSGSLNVKEGREPHVRATSVLRDILERIHFELLAYVTDPDTDVASGAIDALNGMVTSMQRTILEDEEVATEAGDINVHESSAGWSLGVKSQPEAGASGGANSKREKQTKVARTGRPQHALYYQEVGQALNSVLDTCGVVHLSLLLDEWTAVPLEIQPLLADYLRRCFLAHPRVCLKIASIRHRSQFQAQIDDNLIGFEVGADVAATLELDEHFVFERDRPRIKRLFAELLLRHLSTETSRQASTPDYLMTTYGLSDADGVLKILFTGDRAFTELVRAGEGVPRDFINIFSKAFFQTVTDGSKEIDAGAVRTAASEWYGIDKADNLEAEQEDLLRLLASFVIGRNQVTSFALRKRWERHRLIRELVDLRLLHLVRRNWMYDHSSPGDRCSVFRVDYGSYAPLMGTKRAPRLWSPNSRAIPLPLLDELLERIPE